MAQLNDGRSWATATVAPAGGSTEVQAGSESMRGMVVKTTRKRALTREEARAVADLMQAIRRLLPDEDL
jgi:hypothetical protein